MRGFGVDVSREANKAASGVRGLGLASAAAGKLVILGIGGAMAVSAKAAIDYESSLAGVAKTTDLAGHAFDQANTPLAAFGQAMRDLAERVPVNVNDLNQIAALGGQLGIEVPNLVSFTDTIARLAVSTNLTIEAAATGLARFANIMRTPETDFERLGSVLVELGNNFATTESEILHFATRIAPVAKALGETEEGVFAISAALTSLGIPAERGGTAVQRVLTSISQAVSAGGKDLTVWADTAGVSVDEFAAAFKRAPSEAFALFVKGLNDINEAGGSVFGTLDQLGIKEQRTIQVLLASASGYQVLFDAMNTAAKEGEEVNALQEESARRFGTTASQLQLLGNSFNNLRIEIGSALLGGGGLAAGIDVAREFFRILTDNVDSIISMGQGLAMLAAVPVLLALTNLGVKARTAFVQMKALTGATLAAQGASSKMQFAMSLSNLALGAAAVGIGILIARWIDAAIKAAELRAEVRKLNDEIANGAEPVDVLNEILQDGNILTEERKSVLSDLGISQEAFINQILRGGDAWDLVSDSEREAMKGSRELEEAIRGMTLGLFDANFLLDESGDNAVIFGDLIEETNAKLGALRTIKIQEMVDWLYEANLATGKTRHEMEDLADAAIFEFGIGVNKDQFIDSLTGASVAMAGLRQDADKAAAAQEAATRAGRGDFFATMWARGDDGAALEDWADAILETIDQTREGISERFEEIRSTIIGGMPTTADYETMAALTRAGLDKIILAQGDYLTDLEDWTALRGELLNTLSADAFAFIEGKGPEFAGAFARFWENDQVGAEAWIADLEATFVRAQAVINAQVEQELPAAMERGFGAVISLILGKGNELGLTGATLLDSLAEGIKLAATQYDDDGAAMIAFVTEMFGNDAFLETLGFERGDPLVEGFLAALATLGERSKAVVDREIGTLQENLNRRSGVGSPSKMTYETGKFLAQGLLLGLAETLNAWDAGPMVANFQPKIESLSKPIVNVSPAGSSKTVTVNLNNPTTSNMKQDLQLAGIVGSVLAQT